jgi:hypothetical protein
MRSFSGLPEIRFFDSLNSDLVPETTRIMIFNIVVLLSRLGSFMICTHDQKKKRPAIVNRSDTVANVLSINVSIVLTELVYLQKKDQLSPS